MEHDRAVGFAVEVRLVAALLDEDAGLLFFLPLALDEFHHVWMPDFDGLHLGGAAGLATALHDGCDLVVDAHERERARGRPPPASFSRCERSVLRSVPVPEPNLKSMASLRASSMMSSMLSATCWMKHALPCGYSYGFSGWTTSCAVGIPAPVALRAGDAVLVIQADVEPDGRVERAVLMQAEPGEFAVEAFAIGGAGEVAVFEAPIGDRAGDAVDELLDAVFALGRADFAVEVFAADDVRGQLAPERRHFAVGLLEDQLAVLAFDLRAANFPIDGGEQILDVGRAELGVDLESAVKTF